MEEQVSLENPNGEVKCNSVLEEKNPYPKMILEWTNIFCDNLNSEESKPYRILVKPNKIMCGGIAVGENHQTFACMHRSDCWSGDDPCHDWPKSHDMCANIEYDKKRSCFKLSLRHTYKNFMGTL